MLSQILLVLCSAKEPLSLAGLSREIGAEKSALEGMLDVLILKGKVKVSGGGLADQDTTCASITCAGCGGATHCPFVGKMPRTFELVRKE